VSPAFANPLAINTDSSDATNPDMLRDSSGANWVPAGNDFVANAPVEDNALPSQIDWSVGLRGAYQHDQDGDHYEALLVPSVSLIQEWASGRLVETLDGTVRKLDDDKLRIQALRLAVAGDYRINQATQVSGNAELSTSQDDPLASTSNLSEPENVVAGTVDTKLTRQFGRFTVDLRGNIGREVHGDSTYDDGSVVSNSGDNFSYAGTGLRLGMKLTPILTIFGDGNLQRDVYDTVAPGSLVKSDATEYALRTGISGVWGHGRLEAETSIGVGLRDYKDTSLEDVATTLYDASLTYHPDETWTLRAGFSTEIVPPGTDTSDTQVAYTATGDIAYEINSWLALRASASWTRAKQTNTGIVDTSYGYGVGADYLLNARTTLSADYNFDHIESAPDPVRDAHRVTVGVTFKR
jgi:hypothetical protein